MPEVKFGGKDEPSTSFRQSPDLIVVRTHSERTNRSEAVMSRLSSELRDAQLVASFPEAAVAVYRLPEAEAGSALEVKKGTLRRLPEVRFAGGVLVDDASGEPVVYTENIFVKFVDSVDPDACRKIIADAGLSVKREVPYASNAYFVQAPEGTGQKVFDIASALLARPDVEFCHPEIVRKRARKAIFPQQWHLKRTVVDGMDISAHANIEAAHRITRGEGVTIAIIDDGVDIDHREFSTPGKIVAARDITVRSDDPRPKDSDRRNPDDHGTACAGVACAAGVHGASGVAPGARLMPIRLASALGSMDEADAFVWAADHGADVISCSWGPEDGAWDDPNDPLHRSSAPLPAGTRLAIKHAMTKGRGERGCVVLFAAGNGNESVDNDGYASNPAVIAVAACNDRGKRSAYSDFGKAVWCSFPSNDMADPATHRPEPLTAGIWTTDRTGRQGYNAGGSRAPGDVEGNYCSDFGGTSSACPGAAGVVALMLAVNRDLLPGQVKELLKGACDVIDRDNGAYGADGHSAFYGYGRLNAERAVVLAQSRVSERISIARHAADGAPSTPVRIPLLVGDHATAQSVALMIDLKPWEAREVSITLTTRPSKSNSA